MADVSETKFLAQPSSELVRRLSLISTALTAGAIATQAIAKILQQTSKSKSEKAGLEGAVRLTVAVTLARAVPSFLQEIRTLSRTLRRE